MSEDFATIRNLVASGNQGKYTALLLILHKLGGWTILAAAALFALGVLWQSREAMASSYLEELRESRAASYRVIEQNTAAFEKLSAEIKRLNNK